VLPSFVVKGSARSRERISTARTVTEWGTD